MGRLGHRRMEESKTGSVIHREALRITYGDMSIGRKLKKTSRYVICSVKATLHNNVRTKNVMAKKFILQAD